MSDIRKLPASAGAQWLLDAFSLYRRAPLQLAVLGVIGMLVSSLILVLAQALPSWLGVLGQLVSVAVGPLVFGTVYAAIVALVAIALLELGWRFSRVVGSRRSFGEVVDDDPGDEQALATASPSA